MNIFGMVIVAMQNAMCLQWRTNAKLIIYEMQTEQMILVLDRF